MAILNTLLEKHIKIIEMEFKRLPKSRVYSGNFSVIQNKLVDVETYSENASNIVNRQHKKLIDEINANFLDKFSDEELECFIVTAKNRYSEILKKSFIDTWNR